MEQGSYHPILDEIADSLIRLLDDNLHRVEHIASFERLAVRVQDEGLVRSNEILDALSETAYDLSLFTEDETAKSPLYRSEDELRDVVLRVLSALSRHGVKIE